MVFEDDETAQKYGYRNAKGVTPAAKLILAVVIGSSALSAIVLLIAIIVRT